MIKSEHEYQGALERLREMKHVADAQRDGLEAQGFAREHAEHALQPQQCLIEQLKEEVEEYERIKRGDLRDLCNLSQIGRLLIGMRIHFDMSQSELASRLGISQAAVCKDERNEYHGITVERAQRILDAMGARITLSVDPLSLLTARVQPEERQ